MDNYSNVNWLSTAIAQNRKNHPEIEASENIAKARAVFDKQLADSLNLNKDNTAYTGFDTSIEKGNMKNPYWSGERPSMSDILSYLLYNPGKSLKVLDKSEMSTNENDLYNSYGNYSLDDKGMLQRTGTRDYTDVGQDSGGWLDFSGSGLLSGLTLGASDLIKGQMPGTDWAGQGTIAQIINPAAQVHSMFTGGATDALYGLDKAGKTGGSFWDKLAVGADRAIDPFGVDPATRGTGNLARKMDQSTYDKVAGYAPAVGAAIGSLIYPGAGTAAGYGIGSKLAAGTRNYDYLKDLLGAGVSYAGGALGGSVGGAVKGLTGSAIAGGAAGGATGGVVSGVPAAVQQKSLNPLWQGALVGGVAGGVGTGARIGAYGLGASKAIADLTGNVAGKVASTGMKQLWLNNNKG